MVSRVVAAQVLEGDGGLKLHRLDIVAAAVAVAMRSGFTISSKVIRFS